MSARLTQWMEGYLTAWSSNDADAVARLFVEDAVYDTQTGGEPWDGRDAIVAGWLSVADKPGTWQFSWEPLIESDSLAIITGETVYSDDPPKVYRNLWVIEFGADDRCRSFTEWYVRVKQP